MCRKTFCSIYDRLTVRKCSTKDSNVENKHNKIAMRRKKRISVAFSMNKSTEWIYKKEHWKQCKKHIPATLRSSQHSQKSNVNSIEFSRFNCLHAYIYACIHDTRTHTKPIYSIHTSRQIPHKYMHGMEPVQLHRQQNEREKNTKKTWKHTNTFTSHLLRQL